MSLRLGRTLTGKILVCAGINVLLLLGVVIGFIQFELAVGPEPILLSPGQSRARMLAARIERELHRTPAARRTELLARIERDTGLSMGLFLSNGQPAGGSLQNLPQAVVRIIRGPSADEPPGEPEFGPPMRPHAPPTPGKGRPEHEMAPPLNHPVYLARADQQYWVVLRLPIIEPGQRLPYLGALVLRSSTLLFNPFLIDLRPWIAAALLLLLMTLACWLPLVRSLTLALRRITDGAEQIAGGRFSVKLPVDRGDEIDQLSQALNRMALQLDGFVHGQKRFLGDIAHELSAPLARTQMSLGILEDRVEAGHLDYVEGLREEVQQMSALVNELLQFSRAGFQSEQPTAAPVQVGELVQRVIEREVTPAFCVELVEGSELTVLAQFDGLFRALCNVVRNAIRYAGKDGPITIAARPQNGEVVLVVADQGPGLPEEAIERVFAPFYRVDTSRSRESGGTGLGLAIVKACIESSGGSVFCRNRSPRGLEVWIALKACAE